MTACRSPLLAAALGLVLAACGGQPPSSQPPGSQAPAGTLAAATAPAPGTPGVRATTVASRSIERGVSRVVTADGALELPAPPQALAFPKPGTVREVLVRDGQPIAAGDVLARMDPAPFEVEVAAAEVEAASAAAALRKAQSGSALETARQDLERAKNQLWSQQISRDGQCQLAKERADNDPSRDRGDNDARFSAECNAAQALVQAAEASVRVAEINLRTVEQAAGDDVAIARARVRQATAALAQARDALARAEIKAPFDGAVVSVSVAAGAQAGAGPALTVARTTPLAFVTSNLSERYVGDLREGARATVTLTAYPDRALPATVRHIAASGTVDAAGAVVFRVFLDLEPTDLPLYAGMTGRVEIDAGAIDGAVVAPAGAAEGAPAPIDDDASSPTEAAATAETAP